MAVHKVTNIQNKTLVLFKDYSVLKNEYLKFHSVEMFLRQSI